MLYLSPTKKFPLFYSGIILVVIAIIQLIIWHFGFSGVTNLFSFSLTMNPLVAFCFIITGILMVYLPSQDIPSVLIVKILALVMLFISFFRLLEVFGVIDTTLDLVIFSEQILSEAIPSRFAPGTALNFFLICIVVLSFDLEKRFKKHVSQYLIFIVILTSLISLAGYLYEVTFNYNRLLYPMSAPTALLFLFVSFFLFNLHPHQGIAGVFNSKYSGGHIGRRLVPIAILVPVLVGLLRVAGQKQGYFSMQFGVTWSTVIIILVFLYLIYSNANSLNKIDEKRELSEADERKNSCILEEILKNLMISVCRIDQDGNFLEVKGKAFGYWSTDTSIFNGLNIHNVFANQKQVVREILKMKNEPIMIESEMDGTGLILEAYSFPDIINPGGAICICYDITHKKKVEKELQAARQKAEHANQLKSRFLSSMSHEIRTPINTILGFTEVLQKHNISEKDKKTYLQYISSSGQLLLTLISDILDISRIEEGKIEIIASTFHISEAISSNIIPYQHKAQEKGVDFILEIDEGVPAYVEGDRDRICQVLINLVGNAIKFTTEGFIKVSVRLIELSSGKATIRFSVEDSGIGVPLKSQKSIFEPFKQASNVTKKFGGSGLGLSIVKELVELMGGQIELRSPSNIPTKVGGPGSAFSFLLQLPVKENVISTEVENEQMEVSTIRGANILIVEDNIINQALLQFILEKVGCNFDMANNGEEALAYLNQKEYVMVFMDVQMPVMDGLKATKLIRETGNKVPIIGLTANVFKEDVEKCIAAGMNDFLGKPFDEAQFVSKLKKWLY